MKKDRCLRKRFTMKFIWARSNYETSSTDIDGNKTILPKKWTNPWIRPYKMIRWDGPRYCIVESNEKKVRYHVNRLTKHRQWDEINPDTFKWEVYEKTGNHKDLQEQQDQEDI